MWGKERKPFCPRAINYWGACGPIKKLSSYVEKIIQNSLRASSPFGGYRKKWTREEHARGDAKATPCGILARSRKMESLLAGYMQNGRRISQETKRLLFPSQLDWLLTGGGAYFFLLWISHLLKAETSVYYCGSYKLSVENIRAVEPNTRL